MLHLQSKYFSDAAGLMVVKFSMLSLELILMITKLIAFVCRHKKISAFSVTIGHSFPYYPEVKMVQSVIRLRTSETDGAVIYLASTLMVLA